MSRLLQLRITHIISENEQCKTFMFDAGKQVAYHAGQFITIVLHINQKELRRSYSLTSTPGVDNHLSICIKRIQNGAVSRYIFDHWQVGQTVEALPPVGTFTIKQSQSLYFFIAAGSGITPVYALLKHVLLVRGGKAVLVYQNTNEYLSIFRSELQQLVALFPEHFKLIELFSQPQQPGVQPKRLNNYLVEKLVLETVHSTSVQFFVCGPKAFMLIIGFTLRVMGYKDEQVKKENFVIDKIPAAPKSINAAPHNVLVHQGDKYYEFTVQWPANILEQALKNKMPMPYSCRGARCSTCMAKCLKGKIIMSMNDVLTDQDLQKGYVLTCVGYAETDIELTYDFE